MRRMTNEKAAEDLRDLRIGGQGRRLQGRADALPLPDGAGQNPAQPPLGHVRSASAAAQHRNQAGSSTGTAAVYQRIWRLRPAAWKRSGEASPQMTRSWRAVCVLVAYLLVAPPVLLFGPLAGLLLLSRPASAREWLWLIISGMWTALWLNQGEGLAGQFARAGAVLLIGTFLALTVWQPSARFSRSLTATTVAGAALTLWMWRLDVGWDAVRRGVENELWSTNRQAMLQLGMLAEAGSAGQGLLDQMSELVRTIGAFYPALLFLAGLAGLRLAWSWYHRVVARPIGPPPPAFAEFKFSDQLVWGWVVGLAVCLLGPSPGWIVVGSNLLLVWSVLY